MSDTEVQPGSAAAPPPAAPPQDDPPAAPAAPAASPPAGEPQGGQPDPDSPRVAGLTKLVNEKQRTLEAAEAKLAESATLNATLQADVDTAKNAAEQAQSDLTATSAGKASSEHELAVLKAAGKRAAHLVPLFADGILKLPESVEDADLDTFFANATNRIASLSTNQPAPPPSTPGPLTPAPPAAGLQGAPQLGTSPHAAIDAQIKDISTKEWELATSVNPSKEGMDALREQRVALEAQKGGA